MNWNSPEDAMPWVGLYSAVASLLCTLAMAADVFQGVRLRKPWFPCRFFTINAASLTLIAIAMKLPVDLTTDLSSAVDYEARCVSVIFLLTMLANFLPSLGLMGDKELLMNIIALGILVITITANLCIEYTTGVFVFAPLTALPLLCFSLLWSCSLALSVPTTRRILETKYQEMHILASDGQERIFSYEGLTQDVKKYWTMAETGNCQFVIACSPICSAFGVICSYLALVPLSALFYSNEYLFRQAKSDYKWSINMILVTQSIGASIGSIAPIFRCFTAFSYKFSKKRSMNHLNVFRVEKYWTQRLQDWKHSRVDSCVPGLLCKKVVHDAKNMSLNICIGLQIIVVVICKTIRLLPNFVVIFFSCCFYCCKSLLRRFKNKVNSSSNDTKSEVEEYASYVLQIEEQVKLSQRVLRNTLNSMTQLICKSEKQEPSNLLKLLQKSIGWNGVIDFDDDQVPPLHPEKTVTSWSLVAVTLTAIAIAIALPKIDSRNVKVLLATMSEGLSFVSHIEECLNAKRDLVNIRKVAHRVWTDVQLHCKWLQIDLQKKARKGKTSQEILQWLGDEAVKMVLHSKQSNKQIHEDGLHQFVAADLMYRISQAILLHCNGQESWPNDEELFEQLSSMIADILCASFTNLPQVITMKCYDSAIETREESIRTAAQLLGKTKKILSILQQRELPTLNLDSMAYIGEWHALLKSQNSIASASSTSNLPASSSSGELVIVTTA